MTRCVRDGHVLPDFAGDLPMTRVAAALAAAFVVLAAGAGAWFAFGARGDAFADCRESGSTVGAAIGGPFTLVDAAGRTVTDAEVIDRPTLIYFGYTFCPDFCPTDAANMAAAHDLLQERGVDANIVFVTVDPARDTPDVVGAFARNLHPRMVGLTGTPEAVAHAARAYRVYFARSGDDPRHYLMDHSTFTYLMAPGVGFLDFFRHGTPPQAIADRVACYAAAL
jgi:protein SCO1/2